MKFYIHHLGCDKNRVDGEKLCARLSRAGFKHVPNPEKADFVIVNTCGFIDMAKEESIDTIIQFAAKKEIVATGCLSKRYDNELKDCFKEITLVAGLADKQHTFNAILRKYGKHGKIPLLPMDRTLSSPCHAAPLKISEGCSNCCTYCIIPAIRGRHRSRSENDILKETRYLRRKGVKELVMVGQDITAYRNRRGLPGLLRKIIQSSSPFEWIRLMYCHPIGITDSLVKVIAEEPSIVNYIDIPVQHASNRLLRKMNRPYSRDYVLATFLIGFPGETEKDFKEIIKFVQEVEFDHLGTFAYSPEKGTPAYRMHKRVPDDVIRERINALTEAQTIISRKKNGTMVGKTVGVLIDEWTPEGSIGRTEWDAPEVDRRVIIRNRKLKRGGFYNLTIVDTDESDFYAEK
jgi:ribosomal protein S12 methylthiotransferase